MNIYINMYRYKAISIFLLQLEIKIDSPLLSCYTVDVIDVCLVNN